MKSCYNCSGKGWIDERQFTRHYSPDGYDRKYGNRLKAWCGTLSHESSLRTKGNHSYQIQSGWSMDFTNDTKLVTCRRCLTKLDLPAPDKETCNICDGEGHFNEWFPDPIPNPYPGSFRSELKSALKNRDRKRKRELEDKGEEITGEYRPVREIPTNDYVIPCRRCGNLFEDKGAWMDHCAYVCKNKEYNPYFPSNGNIIIEGFNITKESDKAIMVKQNEISEWIPRSQVKIDIVKNQLEIPTWLWIKKKFA